MKKINIKIAVISVLLALVTLFLFGCQETAILPPTLIDIERTGQDLPLTKGAGMTAEQLAAAILTPGTATLLTAASTVGSATQFEVYTASLTGFPTDGSSYALMSTGNASGIAGVATDFYSFNTGGPGSPPLSHRGNPSYDIARLSLTLSVPAGAETLSFDWKFGTEENPTYLGSMVDWASAIVTTSSGPTNILLLPGDIPVDVDNAVPFSNAVTGSSQFPDPLYPSPDHTVYNAVTTLMYASTFNVAPFVGETITVDFWVGDENDPILDSALFIDNLIIEGEIDVAVDIKPESCPNPLNVKSKGVFPVAILGTEDFDVTEIDPDTITLWTEDGGDVTPLRWALEDVATPYDPSGEEEEYMCTTDGPDGYLDFTLKFDAQEIVDALGEPEDVDDGDVEYVWLTGNLLNGITINGKDVIIIIKKGK